MRRDRPRSRATGGPETGPESGLDAGDALRCLVCGGPRSPYEPVAFVGDPGLVRRVSTCTGCGYVSIEELPVDNMYRTAADLGDLPAGGSRIGTMETPGREFHMAKMAVDILGRRNLDVLVYGIGNSMDNHHIAALKRVRHVAIGDIMRLRDDAEFHDANLPARRRFPVVVASEVVEHFRDPHRDFERLFQFVGPHGLLVCGTNVFAGGDLARHRYVFYRDHTSYYTPAALLEIARTHGFLLDFRTPAMAHGKGRKRYVLLTRSADVLQRASLYFGAHAVAPSE